MNFDFKKALQKELNVGLKEQKYRYGGGAAALALSVFTGNIFLLVIGIVLVATAFMRWCPAYSGMGRSTVDPNEPAPTSEGSQGGQH
jgi:uncharacterized membrane protein YidH (DUF202 family)